MKRRSSFFRRDLQPEDESLSTTADEDKNTGYEQSSKTELNEELIRQHINDLKAEQKEWVAESDSVKLMYKNLKEAKNRLVKVNKADLYSTLSETDKVKYSVLFNREDYGPLLRSIQDLKKKVAIVSSDLAHNQSLLESRLRQHSNQGLFENLMNQLAVHDSGYDDWPAGSEGDEMSEFLDSESESEVMETD